MPVLTGTLSKWFDAKGFGFIKPDDGGHDCFTHIRQLTNATEAAPQEGCRVQFETAQDPHREKPKTESWTIIGGAAAPNPAAQLMGAGMVPLAGAAGGATPQPQQMQPQQQQQMQQPGFAGAPGGGAGVTTPGAGTGVLKRWYADKGFGFITPDDGSSDFFAHVRQLTNAHEAMQEDGAKVKYVTELDAKQGKLKAQTWTVVANAAGVPAPQTPAPLGAGGGMQGMLAAGAGALTMGPGGVTSLNLPPPPPAAMSTPGQPMVVQPPPVVPLVHKTEEVDVPEMFLAQLVGTDGMALEVIKKDAGGDIRIELTGAPIGDHRTMKISGPEISVSLGSLLVLQRLSELV